MQDTIFYAEENKIMYCAQLQMLGWEMWSNGQ